MDSIFDKIPNSETQNPIEKMPGTAVFRIIDLFLAELNESANQLAQRIELSVTRILDTAPPLSWMDVETIYSELHIGFKARGWLLSSAYSDDDCGSAPYPHPEYLVFSRIKRTLQISFNFSYSAN